MQLIYIKMQVVVFIIVLTSLQVYWGDWSQWSECERHCSSAKGVNRRVRVCFRSANDQHLIQPFAVCNGKLDGDFSEENECYDVKCDGTGGFVGTWSAWEPWTCTYKSGICGDGINVRIRSCTKAGDSVSLDSSMRVASENCPEGSDTDEEKCFARCPPNTRADKYGGWSDWTSWACTKGCKPGLKASRERKCNNPLPLKGYSCPGESSEKSPCEESCIKQWGEWLHWTQCTKTCDQAMRERTRDCKGTGKPCEGEVKETKRCLDQTRHQLCPPVDGKWSMWSFWTEGCSVTCERGVRVRERKCNNPPQAGVGKDCKGKANDTMPCTINVPCPVDGKWEPWAPVRHCSKDCGGGSGYSNRTCIPPRNGGTPCEGNFENFELPCNIEDCPDATLPPALANGLRKLLDESHVNLGRDPGDNALMDCTAAIRIVHQNYSDARIEWRRNGQRLAIDGARIQLDTGRLVFEAVNSGDNGVYTCQAEAGGVKNVILAVFSLAVPPEAPDIQGYEAEGLEIPCNGAQLGLLFDGFTTQWYKGDKLIKSYEDVEPEEVNVEHFKNIDERYAGVYRCVVIHFSSQRQWVTNIAQVEVLPKRAMHKRLMAMAKTKATGSSFVMIAGGVGGVLVVFLIGCCICVCCCFSEEDDLDKDKSFDREAAKPLLGDGDRKRGGKPRPGDMSPAKKGPPSSPAKKEPGGPPGAAKPGAPPSKATGKGPPKSPGKGAPKPAGKAPPKSPGKGPPGKAPSKSPGKAPPKSPGKAPSKSPGKAPPKSPGKAPPKSPGKAPPKKSPAKSPAKAPNKSASKSPPKSAKKPPGKGPAKPGVKIKGGSPKKKPGKKV
eukprot:XP_011660976.1 PREDICTED: uncharacterized protein LOC105436761 [Strongylocentrotus purpuratus]